jgi:putative peptidoglycan lipid II flippase
MNLLRAASTVSLFTLASRITGLAREAVVAATFGASGWMDAFQVAFRIPNLLRRLFAEGAFSQAFVPILAETRAREGDETTHRLVDAVATVLFWALLATCGIGIVAAPVVVWLMASGLERFDGAVVMTRWMFPYIGFMSMVAFSSGILNTWKRFALPAATPVLLNLSVIGAAWALSPVLRRHGIEPIYALAIGVMLGGVLQLAVQIPALLRIGCLPHVGMTPGALRSAFQHPGVLRVLRQMAPALLGVSVAQLSLLINTQIASHQGVGAVSWLTYADRLMEFPTALLGVALGVVLLPQLSAAQAQGESARYSGLLDWGLRLVLLLALPCAVALLVFPQALVAVLYHYGAITARDVERTSTALMGYGVGLMGLIGVKILAPGFYARQDIRTPVRIASALARRAANLVRATRARRAGVSSAPALLNALLLGLRGVYRARPGWAGFLLRVGAATALLGAGLAWAAQAVDWIALAAQPALRIALLAGALITAAVLYFGALALLGVSARQFVRKA